MRVSEQANVGEAEVASNQPLAAGEMLVDELERGIAGGELGEGAAIAVSMIPFLIFATLFSYFGLARRKWQQGESND